MKARPSPAIAITTAVVTAVILLASGCGPKKRADWRSPAPPMLCSSDAECARSSAGTCTIAEGATQGTCTGHRNQLPALPPPPGGTSPAPGPNVQPLPTDIQI